MGRGETKIALELDGRAGSERFPALAAGQARRPRCAERFFVRQFGHPGGLFGCLAGRVMARMNVEVNAWVVELLEVGRRDRFLDVGCGPGLAVEVAAFREARLAAGIDPSRVMVRQARRRNRDAIRAGRAAIQQAAAEALPYPDAFFTKAAAVNSLAFWDDREGGLREFTRVLAPAGVAALVLRVRRERAGRLARASHGASREQVERVAAAVNATGFDAVQVRSDEVRGETMAAIVARKPEARDLARNVTGQRTSHAELSIDDGRQRRAHH